MCQCVVVHDICCTHKAHANRLESCSRASSKLLCCPAESVRQPADVSIDVSKMMQLEDSQMLTSVTGPCWCVCNAKQSQFALAFFKANVMLKGESGGPQAPVEAQDKLPGECPQGVCCKKQIRTSRAKSGPVQALLL